MTNTVKRYWVSWWECRPKGKNFVETPFQYWVSGWREGGKGKRDEPSLCAMIDAPSEAAVWAGINRYFPHVEERFCTERPIDDRPGDRCPGFQNRTSLVKRDQTEPSS